MFQLVAKPLQINVKCIGLPNVNMSTVLPCEVYIWLLLPSIGDFQFWYTRLTCTARRYRFLQQNTVRREFPLSYFLMLCHASMNTFTDNRFEIGPKYLKKKIKNRAHVKMNRKLKVLILLEVWTSTNYLYIFLSFTFWKKKLHWYVRC